MSRFRLRPLTAFARFARAEKGAIAVEFAIIALPFLVLLFGIVELGMVFLVSTTLQNATDAAARKIRTGEFQTSGSNTKADFKTLVCNYMTWLQAGCAASSKLTVNVQTFADFTTLNANSGPTNTQTFNPNTTCWSSGRPGDIVLVRTYYEWQVFTPFLNNALVNRGTNIRLISAAASFRNEPWSSQSPTGAAC